jgi:hypothetical protein
MRYTVRNDKIPPVLRKWSFTAWVNDSEEGGSISWHTTTEYAERVAAALNAQAGKRLDTAQTDAVT